ncbi:MAG: hypothetical protein ACREUF_03000 [Solimonas sp.]
MIASLVSFFRRVVWMSIGALVVNPAYVRAKRQKPIRRHPE